MRRIRESGNYAKAIVYVDGSNLSRSLAYCRERKFLKENALVRLISWRRENYAPPTIDRAYSLWYLAWCVAVARLLPTALVEEIVFVMCSDSQGVEEYLEMVREFCGATVITPKKVGRGRGSSSAEDEMLKSRIATDLATDAFDFAVIGTGDGKAAGGTGFPQLARAIERVGKQVHFVGFGFSTHRWIKQGFHFFDLANLVCVPRLAGIEYKTKDGG